MRYLLLIYEEPPATPPTDAEWAAMMPEYNALRRLGRGEGLDTGRRGARGRSSTATTVSVRDGRRIVTDGPFAETKEHLGGYYLVEAPVARRRDRGSGADPRRADRPGRDPADHGDRLIASPAATPIGPTTPSPASSARSTGGWSPR